MNRKPFGKKCQCTHYESEHLAGEIKYENLTSVQVKTMFGLLPLLESKLERTNCKICDCKEFNSEKKGWDFTKWQTKRK